MLSISSVSCFEQSKLLITNIFLLYLDVSYYSHVCVHVCGCKCMHV